MPMKSIKPPRGVEADFRKCLAEWESLGRIQPFLLGGRDPSDRLLIPEKLYGREPEIEALIASFDRVVGHGRAELVLVHGYSGIGKSSIVNELHKVLVPAGGLFAASKFDRYKRDIPYGRPLPSLRLRTHRTVSRRCSGGFWARSLDRSTRWRCSSTICSGWTRLPLNCSNT
jgi:AAA ATPase domain